MVVLAIETSTQVCSAAWCIDGQCVAERIHLEGANHAALLPSFIDELLVEAKQHNWVADAVAVSEGPGSYTGLRIGLSTAKGLCYGWSVPLIPIPTLDILCASALASAPLSGILIPMIDARRMEVYTCLYSHIDGALSAQGEVMAKVVENNSWIPSQPAFFFGDGAAKCRPLLETENCYFVDKIVPRASVMGQLVTQHTYPMIHEKELAYYTPFYLKDFIAAPSHIKGLK